MQEILIDLEKIILHALGYTLIICVMQLNLPRGICFWVLQKDPYITEIQVTPNYHKFSTVSTCVIAALVHEIFVKNGMHKCWDILSIQFGHYEYHIISFQFQLCFNISNKDENTIIQFTFKRGLHIIYIFLYKMQCKLLNSLVYSQLKLNQIIWLQQEFQRFRN